jgi:hypothetical protein
MLWQTMPPFMSEPVKRRARGNKDEVVVGKPSIIVNYMTNMGRVDTAHQYLVRLCPLEDSEMVVKIILLGYEGCNNRWIHPLSVGRDGVVGIATHYGLDSLGIESRCG